MPIIRRLKFPCLALVPVALLLLVPAGLVPASALADEATERTIHVPKGWEGAYDFGYAPVVRVGEMVIVSGIPAGGPGTYEEKIERMYERARDLLEEAGASIEDVVELTTFHTQATSSAGFHAEFDSYMPIHKKFFGEHRPAWTAVGTTALLSPGAPVEMRVIAVVGSGAHSKVVWGDPTRAAAEMEKEKKSEEKEKHEEKGGEENGEEAGHQR